MCNDVVAVVKAMYGDAPPAIVLVGHRSVVSSLQHISQENRKSSCISSATNQTVNFISRLEGPT